MSRDTRFLGRFSPAWKYALIGGLLSIPLSLADYWLSGMGTEYSANMVVLGGIVAGYLAQKNGVSAAKVGLGAGFIGGLPLYVSVADGILWFVSVSQSTVPTVIAPFFGFSFVVVCTIAGGVGGLFGGWIAKKVEKRLVSAASL